VSGNPISLIEFVGAFAEVIVQNRDDLDREARQHCYELIFDAFQSAAKGDAREVKRLTGLVMDRLHECQRQAAYAGTGP
jgi:hypothetical protein